MLLTLDFIKSFNLNKIALQTINRNFARRILDGYGIENNAFYDKYNSPLEFFHFFDKYNISQNEKKDNILKKLEVSSDDFNNLMNGYPVSTDLIRKLKDIKSGKIKTTNIINEIKHDLNNHKHL